MKNDEGEGPWSPTTFGYTKAHASGMPDISGTARVSQTLTAGTSGISDGNGKSKAENGDVGFAYTYQWVRSVSGTDTDISGETASTYTLTAADVGNTVKVKASFTDNAGYAEGPLTSNAYPTSGSVLAAFTDATLSALALVNNNGTTIALTSGFLTGTKSYTAMAGHSVSSITLTPTVNEVNATVAYLNASDAAITDTDLNTPALDAPLVVGDNTFKVKVTAEDTTTTDTYTVVVMRAATNAAATGTPSIVGTPQVGMMLTAAKGTIADFDGTTKADNGDTGYAYSYQWVRVDGSTETPITSATASTYTLTATDLGKTIKVQTSFTDDGDTAEGPLTSAATVAVLAAAGACPTDNDWCTTLTVEFQQQSPSVHYYGYADSISLGALGDRTISYGGRNWRLDALYIEDDAGTRTINIDDFFTNGFLPRGSVFTLGGQDFTATAAAEISATTSYIWPAPAGMAWIDGQKVTVSVTLANFAATGTPAISGTAQVGETLTAAIGNIADTDGLPTTFPDDYAFQWLRVDADGMSNETDIGADAVTYTPVAADVGKKVKVKVDFTDAESNPETLTSNAYPSSGTIVSETLPALSISGITVDEDAGSATLTVELDPASTGTVTVVFATRDQVGGAKAGEDYTATSGTLTFAAGQTSKTFTVPITDDDIYENYEAFFVDLSNPTGATLPVYPTAAVGIDSEDAVPTASMADVTVDEGAGTMTLILRLSHPSQEDIAYLTSAGNVTGTATEGEDYDDFLPGPGRTAIFTVPAFNLSQTFDITIVDDSVDEPDETIVIGWHKHISDDATPGAFNFIGTITDNDTAGNTAPVFTDGASTSRDFNETLGDAAVITASNIGTAVGATDSNNDTLAYSLEGADAARLGIIPTTGQLRTMAGEKYDFEAQPSYAVTVRVVDGNGGSDTIDVTVNVNNNSGETPLAPAPPTVTTTPGSMTGLDVNWVAPDNSGRPAISSYDTRYRAGAGGGWTDGPQGVTGTSASITGLAQDTSYQVQVRALNEDGDGDWSSSGSARTGAPPTPTVRFGATSYTAIEGVGGATVTVALSVAASRSVTVRLTKTHLGGATAADYTGVPSSVTFAAGETAQTFTVTAVDDTADDDGESVQLGFDTLPAGATATVRVRLSAAPGRTVTIDLTTENRGATSEDYSGLPGSVTFGASETEKSFTVTATDDSQDDDRESVAIGFGSLPSKVSAGSPSEAVVQLTDNDSVVSRLVVRFDASAEAVRDGVEEGGSYRLGVSLSGTPGQTLTIPLTYTYLGGATAADFTGLPANVTFGTNARSAGVTIRPVDDFEEDPGEEIRVSFGTLPAGVSVSSLSGGSTIIPVIDNDATPGLSVADASAREWPNPLPCLIFVVTMDRMDVDHEVRVDYATRSGTAVAGQDFTPIAGTLVFRPSESRRRTASKRLCVKVLDDSHDEGVEEMTLVLSNPVRAYLADGTGTGHISNTDKMPGAWLTRFGRAASDHVVEAVEERWQGGPQAPHLRIGGRPAGELFGWTGLGGPAGRATADDPEDAIASDAFSTQHSWLSNGADSAEGATAPGMGANVNDTSTALDGLGGDEREAGATQGGRGAQSALLGALGLPDPRALTDIRTLLMGSSFLYSGALDADGRRRTPDWLGEWSAWGRTAASRFSGADGGLSLDGEVATAMLGFDSRWGRWLAGAALSYSDGQGAYRHPQATGGAMASSLTALHPYARFELNERTSLWGVLGYGVGELSLTPSRSATALEADLTNAMAAFGGRTALSVRTGRAGQFELALRSDARLTNTASDSVEGLLGAAGRTGRVRVVLEGSGSLPVWGGMLRPTMEAGLRYDGGDAETGAGLEIGGGLGYAAGRLSVEVTARGLVAHQDTEYEEWGFSGSIAYTPSEDGRGLSMRFGSAWGATQSGVQSLWNPQDTSSLVRGTDFDAGQRLESEISYGLEGLNGRGLWVPFVGARTSDGAQAYRMGLKLIAGANAEAQLEIGRREEAARPPDDAIRLLGTLRW